MNNAEQDNVAKNDMDKLNIEVIEKISTSEEKTVSSTEALKVLRFFWPKIFNVSKPRPLKIGIHKDIAMQENIPEWLISKALQFFTTRDEYLQCIKHGTVRIDLSGGAVGNVRLREAVDAETKRYYQSDSYQPQRRTFLITKSTLLTINAESKFSKKEK